jgi:molybdopterin-guanine dinucleotide biosynthesis protein A
MLDRVLLAVAGAQHRVVVGPSTLPVPPGVWRVSEEPPGGGPVAAIAAGLAMLDSLASPPPDSQAGSAQGPDTLGSGGPRFVALLAADLPFLTSNAVARLLTAVVGSTVDGAVYVDGEGQRQTLCGAWRIHALKTRLVALAAAREQDAAGEAAALAGNRFRAPDTVGHDRIGPLYGAPLRDLVAGLQVAEVPTAGDEPPPWYDCDEPDDLHRAEQWLR